MMGEGVTLSLLLFACTSFSDLENNAYVLILAIIKITLIENR